MPDLVAERLERLAGRAGLPLSTFALQQLSETTRRADNADRLQAPDLIDCRSNTPRRLWPPARAWAGAAMPAAQAEVLVLRRQQAPPGQAGEIAALLRNRIGS